jgi:hypothetical protein
VRNSSLTELREPVGPRHGAEVMRSVGVLLVPALDAPVQLALTEEGLERLAPRTDAAASAR